MKTVTEITGAVTTAPAMDKINVKLPNCCSYFEVKLIALVTSIMLIWTISYPHKVKIMKPRMHILLKGKVST